MPAKPAPPPAEEIEELPTLTPIDDVAGLTPLSSAGGLTPFGSAQAGGLTPFAPKPTPQFAASPLGDDLLASLPSLDGPALNPSATRAAPFGGATPGGYGGSPLGGSAEGYAAPAAYQSGAYAAGATRPGAPIGVLLPAIGMLVTSIPTLLILVALNLPAVFSSAPGPVPDGIDPTTWHVLMRILPIIFIIVLSLWYGAIIYGAIQMMRLRNLAAAKTAAILSIFPCNLVTLFGTAIGIWAIVVLSQNSTKRLFRD